MIVGASATLCVSLVVIASMFTSRPLDVSDVRLSMQERDLEHARVMQFSQLAIGGMLRFGDYCSACHGTYGEGTDTAPSLVDKTYAVDFRERELFHTELARSIPAHRAILRARRGDGQGGELGFNGVEMMAKYLREIRRAGPPSPVRGG
ncbi:MAG: hypothetical protein AAF674_00255 [Pseudomonadota bacterium]